MHHAEGWREVERYPLCPYFHTSTCSTSPTLKLARLHPRSPRADWGLWSPLLRLSVALYEGHGDCGVSRGPRAQGRREGGAARARAKLCRCPRADALVHGRHAPLAALCHLSRRASFLASHADSGLRRLFRRRDGDRFLPRAHLGRGRTACGDFRRGFDQHRRVTGVHPRQLPRNAFRRQTVERTCPPTRLRRRDRLDCRAL